MYRNVVCDICDDTNILDSSKVSIGKHSIDNNVAKIELRYTDSNLLHNFSIQDIWQVKFPKKISSRYNELHGLFLQLSDYAKNDKLTYQRSVLQLKSMIDVARGVSNNSSSIKEASVYDIPLPPITRNDRKHEGTQNLYGINFGKENKNKKRKYQNTDEHKTKQHQMVHPQISARDELQFSTNLNSSIIQYTPTMKTTSPSLSDAKSLLFFSKAISNLPNENPKLNKNETNTEVITINEMSCYESYEKWWKNISGAVSSANIEYIKLRKHKLKNDPEHEKLPYECFFRSIGTIIDVPRDGNCGYHVIGLFLVSNNMVSNTLYIDSLRYHLHQYALSINPETFYFQFEPTFRLRNNYQNEKMENWWKTLLASIYCQGKSYANMVSNEHWMDPNYICPILVHKFKVKIYLYDAHDNGNSGHDMRTTIFSVSGEGKVQRDHFNDLVTPILTQTTLVILLYKNHFYYVVNK